MKLIDILVEELPKRGGWPEGVSKISSTSCGRVFFDGQSPHGFTLPVASDAWDRHKHPFSYTNAVTREQYEAALAAKNDGWIDWPGGVIPISTNTFVDVKFNNGDVRLGKIAGEYSWEHVWEDSGQGSPPISTGFRGTRVPPGPPRRQLPSRGEPETGLVMGSLYTGFCYALLHP